MVAGDGENSYAANSRIPEKAILESRLVLRKVTEEVYRSLPDQQSTMVVADLGCSSGPNTLRFVSEVLHAIQACTPQSEEQPRGVEVQFFLNDLPGNDFNLVFRSLEQFQNLVGKETPPFYVAGLPGSYYTKLFPCGSVHIFHSCFALMFRSKVPEEITSCTNLNEGNIYIGKSSSPIVIKLFQEQFKKDFEMFLTLRARELVDGGRMLLTFIGRKSEEMMLTDGDVNTMFELVSKSLQFLVQKGHVKKEKLDSFNLPYYTPSMNEVQELINRSEHFDIEHFRLFESNWDPEDDSDNDTVLDSASSGVNVAKSMRAMLEPMVVDHFGEHIIEELFVVYASFVAKHLERPTKAKFPIITVSLMKTIN
ncbi:Benzoate carboxyl methyltransferase [Hordeum vulgare]|nr:Benzoate carboxyl methyltransferase [Hordeum vulgare]